MIHNHCVNLLFLFQISNVIFVVHRLHWMAYRHITIFHQPTTLQLLGSIMPHFMMVIWNLVIRPSRWYYERSDRVMKNALNSKLVPRPLKWCLNLFSTTSNRHQWIQRTAVGM